jgi:hypothetical protein
MDLDQMDSKRLREAIEGAGFHVDSAFLIAGGGKSTGVVLMSSPAEGWNLIQRRQIESFQFQPFEARQGYVLNLNISEGMEKYRWPEQNSGKKQTPKKEWMRQFVMMNFVDNAEVRQKIEVEIGRLSINEVWQVLQGPETFVRWIEEVVEKCKSALT